MEKQTQSQTDAKRLQTVLDILGLSAFKLAKELGYKSPSSIYNVFKGDANLSTQMALGIINNHPSVNYAYLTKGKGEPILRIPSEIEAQKNLFGIGGEKKREYSEESESKTSNPPDYLSYQLRTLIENSFELNNLVKELIKENKALREVVEQKN